MNQSKQRCENAFDVKRARDDVLARGAVIFPASTLLTKALDGGKTKDHWCIRNLVPIIEAFRRSFHDFLKKFIQRVLTTDFVLSLIGAVELSEFQNSMDQLDFYKHQQTELNILRDYMISKNSAVIEHDYLFIGVAIFNHEPDVAVSIQNRKRKIYEPREIA